MKDHLKKNNKEISRLMERMATKLATIAVVASFAKKHLGLAFETSKIVDFLITKSTILDMGNEQSHEAMEKFMEEYLKNKSKFPDDNANQQGIWGKSVYKDRKLSEIVILYNQFVAIMSKVGFPDTQSVLKALKEKEFIKCEPDKLYTRRKLGGNKVKVIVVDVLAFGESGVENEI